MMLVQAELATGWSTANIHQQLLNSLPQSLETPGNFFIILVLSNGLRADFVCPVSDYFTE